MHLRSGCDSRPRLRAAHEILLVQISPRKGKESQTLRLREIERSSEMDLSLRKRAARARQAASRQQRAKGECERRFQELPCSSNSIQNKERQITLRKT